MALQCSHNMIPGVWIIAIMYFLLYVILDIIATLHCRPEPEPADLQWSGQKIRLDFNLLMCYSITFLSILYKLVWGYIASYQIYNYS